MPLQMLVEWLRECLQKAKPSGRYLVLLYLVRGRLPEALSAHKELLNSCSGPAGVPISCTNASVMPYLWHKFSGQGLAVAVRAT